MILWRATTARRTQLLTHALERERNMRGFAALLVTLLVAFYAVGLLRLAVAGAPRCRVGPAVECPGHGGHL
jgi:heme A synthase